MTAETVVLSPALVDRDAPMVVDPMLLRALGLTAPDASFVESVELGLTESFDAFDARLTARGL